MRCCIVVVLLLLAWGRAQATTYYIAPNGDNSNTGLTQSVPWRTFVSAFSRMTCGDTLVLLNGTYTTSNSGYPMVSGWACSAGSPLTIKALNERQAHLAHDGTPSPRDTALTIQNSAHIVVEGLRTTTISVSPLGTCDCNPIFVQNSSFITFRKLLVHEPNRYQNGHLIVVWNTTDMLVEDTELYNFHRHGLALQNTTRVTVRRMYCNSRITDSLPPGGTPGAPQGENHTGDACIASYPASYTLIENSISENSAHLTEINASGASPETGNSIYGSISYAEGEGVFLNSRGYSAIEQPQNTWIEHLVVINGAANAISDVGHGRGGAYFIGGYNSTVRNSSFINSLESGIWLSDGPDANQYDLYPSFTGVNILSTGHTNYGFFSSVGATAGTSFTWDYVNSYNNGTAFSPNDGRVTHASTTNPQLGTCYVYLPDASPMKTAGSGGGPLGAHILYRYQNGVLTGTPLWDTTTGAFPCGATVPGVNEAGRALGSCVDVHERLHVNSGGCPFPAGYGVAGIPAPRNLRFITLP